MLPNIFLTMALQKTFSSLPPLVRGIITIVLVALILFIIWKIYQFAKKRLENKTNTAVVSDAQKQINSLGDSSSFPDTNYNAAANTIQKLLDGCETSQTELDVIKEVIKTVKKPVDWYKLIVAFGTREVSDCGSFGLSKTSYDLISLLQDQLDTNQVFYTISQDGYSASGTITDSKDILSAYLSTIGINF